MKIILIVIFFLTNSIFAFNQNMWDKVRFANLEGGKSYEISSGTGFYVNPNYILTNQHVVEGCRNIAIRGAVEPALVSLVASDHNLDLAILYTTSKPKRVAYLRINDNAISYGDNLFAVGYPLDHGKTGEYVISKANVLKISKFKNETSIEFTNSVDHGNSGGPLLDRGANVVGVVKAKKTYFDVDDPDKIYQITGIAIGLNGVRDFLKNHGVIYNSNTTYDIFDNHNIENITKEYVVNIHCVK